MSGIKQQFISISQEITKNINDSIENNEQVVAKIMLKLDLLDKCKLHIKTPCIDVFQEVENDLLNSIVFLTQSFYRNSYVCLRSAMELILSYIYYTDRNYEFLLWKNNYIDMTWTKLSDNENGVLCKQYLQLFCNGDLNIDKLNMNIIKCYHKCSEYVHGKYQYMQSINEVKIKYNQDQFENCCNQINIVCDCVIVLVFIRFGKEFKLSEKLAEYIDYWKGILKEYGVNIDE